MAARGVSLLISATRTFTKRLISRNFLSNNLAGVTIKHHDSSRAFLSTTSSFFAERKYSKKHEWVTVEGKIGTVGISQYAQDSLGDVVFVQLPEISSVYVQDEECGAVESVKAVSEIYTPVSGKVTEINTSLQDNPALVNQSCYDKGWLFRLELSDIKECDNLLNEEDYNSYLKSLE